MDLATRLNAYQIEGRYPEYMRELRAATNAGLAAEIFTEVIHLRTWLLSTLP